MKTVLCTVLGSADICIGLYGCLKDMIIELFFILWCLFYCVHFIDSAGFNCLVISSSLSSAGEVEKVWTACDA